MSVVNDSVGSALVPSLARPGGNVTGLTIMAADLVGKPLGLRKELLPRVSRVVLLGNPANPGTAPQLQEAEAAARALGVRLQILEARRLIVFRERLRMLQSPRLRWRAKRQGGIGRPAWFLRVVVVGELLPGERVGEALGDFRQHRCVPRPPLGNDSVVDVLVALLKIGTLEGILDHVEEARACSDLGVSRKSS